jgi:hypothetical protein
LSDVDPTANLVPFDWPWDDNEPILPCPHCASWRAQLFLAGPDGAIWVREWHAVACPIWAEVEAAEQ